MKKIKEKNQEKGEAIMNVRRTKEIKVGGWKLQISEKRIALSEEAVEKALLAIEEWQRVFPKEETWIEKHYKIPSLIIRLDCVCAGAEKILIYEIEERPAGIGLASLVNRSFEEKLKSLRSIWPAFSVVVSPRRGNNNDDLLWNRVITLEEALNSRELLLIRAEPKEEELWPLQSRSVSTLRMKGSKEYGEKLGWWKQVSVEDFEKLPWEDGFVLKPIQGSKCRDVVIWIPSSLLSFKKMGGVVTKTKIQKTLEKHKTMFSQPFIPPMKVAVEGDEDFFMIYRVFFGYDGEKYIPMGGVWNARRKQLKIHGASDAICGPVIIP